MFKIANLSKDKGLVFISDEKILSKLEKYLCFKEVKLDNFCLKANGTKESIFSDINNFTTQGKSDYEGDLVQDLGLVRQEGFKYIKFSNGSFLFFNMQYNHSDFISCDFFDVKDIESAGFVAVIINKSNEVDMIQYNKSTSLSKLFNTEIEAKKGDGKYIENYLTNHRFLLV